MRPMSAAIRSLAAYVGVSLYVAVTVPMSEFGYADQLVLEAR